MWGGSWASAPVDVDPVADPDLVEDPGDGAAGADVHTAVAAAVVADPGEVGGVVHCLSAGEEHGVRHRAVKLARDVVTALPAHLEGAFPGAHAAAAEPRVR